MIRDDGEHTVIWDYSRPEHKLIVIKDVFIKNIRIICT